MATEITIELDSPNGPKVGYPADADLADVEAEVPDGWEVDWDTTPADGGPGWRWSPLSWVGEAHARLARLVGDTEVIEQDAYTYYGSTIIVATLVGDPDSDGEDYYADDVAIAWDAALDRDGEAGACLVPARDAATWCRLRWPATTKAAGFLADGSWGRP